MTMHKFELYTEDKTNLISLAGDFFPEGFTLLEAEGFWKGNRESSACIVVIVEAGPQAESVRLAMRDLAKGINTINNQQATLVYETVGWGEMITERV